MRLNKIFMNNHKKMKKNWKNIMMKGLKIILKRKNQL